MSENTIKHILLLFAMEAEAEHFVKEMNLNSMELKTPNSPCKLYHGEYKNGKVSCVVNGKDSRYGVDLVGTSPGII